MNNCLIEAFNRRLRVECFNENWFKSIEDARQKAETWRRHPYLTPELER